MLHRQRPRWKGLDQRLCRDRRIEPVGPGAAFEDDDLAVMVRRNIRPRLHRQHGEGLAHLRRLAADAGDAEDRLLLLGEEPFVLALLFRILGIGKLVEAVGNDQARLELNSRPSDRKL